jgi:hypothetical protein
MLSQQWPLAEPTTDQMFRYNFAKLLSFKGPILLIQLADEINRAPVVQSVCLQCKKTSNYW